MKPLLNKLLAYAELSPEERREVLEDLFVFGKTEQRPFLTRMAVLLVLSTLIAAKYVRFLRTSMLEVIHQDYIRTAAAKGLHERIIIFKHAFRNAAIPLVTVVAIDLPVLFAGALFTETVYSWPGMGRLFVDSATRFDYSIVMGIVAAIAFLVVVSNLIADVIYGILDPRITYS